MKFRVPQQLRQLLAQELALCFLIAAILTAIVGGAFLFRWMRWESWLRLHQAKTAHVSSDQCSTKSQPGRKSGSPSFGRPTKPKAPAQLAPGTQGRPARDPESSDDRHAGK